MSVAVHGHDDGAVPKELLDYLWLASSVLLQHSDIICYEMALEEVPLDSDGAVGH
jgi:hypothetical protein